MGRVNEERLEYLRLVTGHQASILGYLRSVAPGMPVEDLLQEVNVVLWKRAGDFEVGTNFKAFAFRVAHFKAMEALRAARRKSWLVFDSDLLDAIAEESDTSMREGEQEALRKCLEGLEEAERGLLHRRYTLGMTVREIARVDGRTEGALQQLFFRLREQLRVCIERRLSWEGGSR